MGAYINNRMGSRTTPFSNPGSGQNPFSVSFYRAEHISLGRTLIWGGIGAGRVHPPPLVS